MAKKRETNRLQNQQNENWASVFKYFISQCFRMVDTGRIGPFFLFVVLIQWTIYLYRCPADKLPQHGVWLQSVIERLIYIPWFIAIGFFALSCYFYRQIHVQRKTYRDRINELAGQKAELEKKLIPHRLSSLDAEQFTEEE